jgi:hypothetical protein
MKGMGGKQGKVKKGGENGRKEKKRKLEERKEVGKESVKHIGIWTECKREIGNNRL